MTKIHISKLDAAKRQLETSIILFFNDVDIVATHVLVSAALQILEDCCNKQSLKSERQTWLENLDEAGKKRTKKKIGEAYNFFKHADKDTDKTLAFNPDYTKFVLFFCCKTYQNLTKESPSYLAVFLLWFYALHPQLIEDPEYQKKAVKCQDQCKNKKRFFRESLPIVIEESVLKV